MLSMIDDATVVTTSANARTIQALTNQAVECSQTLFKLVTETPMHGCAQSQRFHHVYRAVCSATAQSLLLAQLATSEEQQRHLEYAQHTLDRSIPSVSRWLRRCPHCSQALRLALIHALFATRTIHHARLEWSTGGRCCS